MPVGDIFRVEVHHSVGSRPTMNVLHLRETVSITDPEKGADNAIIVVDAAMHKVYENLSEEAHVVIITARRIFGGVAVPATVIYGGAESIVGSVADEPCPPQAAALCSFYTLVEGKKGRGRAYFPGWPEANQADGQMTQAAFAAFQTDMATAFLGEKSPGGGLTGRYRFIVWSPTTGSSADSHIRDIVAHPSLATQRRRRALEGFAP